MSIYNRILLLLAALLSPVLLMNGYSNQVSEDVLDQQIQSSNYNQLSYFLSLIDASINRLKLNAIVLSNDPSVKEFAAIPFLREPLENQKIRSLLQDKINLQALSYDWTDRISIYSVTTQEVISTDPQTKYDEAYLRNNVSAGWVYKGGPPFKPGFYSYVTGPFTSQAELDRANLIVEVSLSEDKIQTMLDEFKASGRGDPFLYSGSYSYIGNRSRDETLIREVIGRLLNRSVEDPPTFTLQLNGKGYLVNTIQSKTTGWSLVDYVSLEDVLAPINHSRTLFRIGLAVLCAMAFLTSYGLYRQVQRPIRTLIMAVKRLKSGDYSFRLKALPQNEFAFLFMQFNEMTATIQELMEKVVVEKLHTREAVMKQLQSQIDPHFLYNCLGFIANMTKLRNEDAVLAMAYNLSDYYRYTTRLEKKEATLREELKMVTHYLEIQNLRMNRIRYEIEIPDDMLDMRVPLLLLQPIVENSVVHGIQKKIGSGMIRIAGKQEGMNAIITVEDDGPGLDEAGRRQLERKVREALDEEVGCGMWNVHRRLAYFFGEGAGLYFEPSPLGGLRTLLLFGKVHLHKEGEAI